MVLKLYGFMYSTATQRVILVLKELNVPFEWVDVDMRKGEHKSAEYMAKQPFGQVPFIDDDGFHLFESRAICRYIVAKYSPGSSLVPVEVQAQALYEQAISIETCDFEPPASVLLHEKVIAKHYGRAADEARVEEAVKKIERIFDVYEAMLSKRKYLAGDGITLGDLFHVPLGQVVGLVKPETISTRPNLARWWSDLTSRPSAVALIEAIKQGGFQGLDCS